MHASYEDVVQAVAFGGPGRSYASVMANGGFIEDNVQRPVITFSWEPSAFLVRLRARRLYAPPFTPERGSWHRLGMISPGEYYAVEYPIHMDGPGGALIPVSKWAHEYFRKRAAEFF